ncbi:hypothetical protein JMN32_20070 [Fulvivirga sp. 29W222]|uniref:Uncharacterized protein n=1 Tax=Fulvivirga marina TaxID=2494733 RepID=A0A937FZ18_9BACT|nr:hypothetical protein [Fulvivirga marina]MBL6448619.1 hypothetical protein [Fulvivirga marina]
MRKIKLTVGNTPVGEALTWAYPAGDGKKLFLIPTYELHVRGTDDSGKNIEETFEVFRFGVQQRTTTSSPRVVGLADEQTHIIKAWLPEYSVHSAPSTEDGAWQVYGNFLIHDGPDVPLSQSNGAYASVGCIEICGVKGFEKFNNLMIRLGGAPGNDRSAKLNTIGSSQQMEITYKKASRPPLKHYIQLDGSASPETSQFFESYHQINSEDEIRQLVASTLQDSLSPSMANIAPEFNLTLQDFAFTLLNQNSLKFTSSALGFPFENLNVSGLITEENGRLRVLLVGVPKSEGHHPGDLPGILGQLLTPFNFLTIQQYGIILSNDFIPGKELIHFGQAADDKMILKPGLNIALLSQLSDSDGVLGDLLSVVEGIIGDGTHFIVWNIRDTTPDFSLDIRIPKDIDLSIGGINIFGLIDPEVSLSAIPPSVEVSGLINFSLPPLNIALPGSIRLGANSISGSFSVEKELESFPPPFGFPGIHLSTLQLMIQAQLNPFNINIGASGAFYIGPDKPSNLPESVTPLSPEEIPGNNEFSIIFTTQGGATAPILLSMYLDELSLDTCITAVTNKNLDLPDFLNAISFHQVMLYWCGSPTPLQQANGALAYPGLGLSGIMQIFGTHVYSELKITSEKNISGAFILDPIRVGGNLLEITGNGKGTPTGYQGAATVSPGGAMMQFDTQQSPYFTCSANVSVLGLVEAGLDAEIGNDGIMFELRENIAGLFSQSLKVSFKSITDFEANSELDIQLTGISIALPLDLGNIKLNTAVFGGFGASFKDNSFSSYISAKFEWNGKTFNLGTLTVEVTDVRKLPEYLVQYILENVAKIFEDLLQNALEWLEAVLDKAIEFVGEVMEKVGKALAHHFEETLEASAKLMKNVGYIAIDTGKALKAGFEKSAQEIANAMKEAGYLAEEVGEVLSELFEMSEQVIAGILNAIGYTAAEIANVLKVVLAQPIRAVAEILKGIGKTAEEVGSALKAIGEPVNVVSDVLKGVFDLGDNALNDILKVVGFPISVVDDLLPHLKHIKAPHIKHIKAPHIKHVKLPHVKVF